MISELNKLGIALKALDGMNLATVGVNTGNLDAFRSAIKGLSTEQAVFALASKGATEEQIRQILITKQSEAADVEAALAKAGLTTATAALNGQEVIELAQKKGLTAERAKEIASNLGLIATEEGQVVSKKQLTVATLKQAGATDAEIVSILGLNAAETANIGITNILTGAVAKLWAVITAHPIGAILTAVGAVAVGVIAYINKSNKDAQKAIVETHEKAQQALDNTKTALSDDKSELESVNSELDSTKQKIQDIASQDTITLTEQNEIDKLSTANNQLETQKSLLENNIKLKQKSAALDAKNLLGTQVEMDYSDIQDGKDVVSHKESHTYAEHAEYEASSLKNAYNIYMDALKTGNTEKQKLAQELIDKAGGDTAELTSSILEIVESFKYDDGTIIEGYEDLYNQYMGLIYNLQSLTNPEMFLDIAKQATEGTNIDYKKAISDGYAMAYDGEFDIDKLNQDFVKALADNGIDTSTIEYIFKLKQQEYQSVVDNINKKYNPDNVLKPTYLTEPGHVDTKEKTVQKELDNQSYEKQKQEVQNINDELTEYAKEHPIEFQLISSYDENFSTLDKYIEEEKSKSESAIQDTKSQLEDLSKNGNVDLTIRPVIDSSAMQAAGWDVEDGSIATTFTQGEFIWQGDEENGQYVYVHYTPILPDGTVLTPDQLSDYLYGTLEGSQNILDADNKGLVLKVDTDLQGISEDDIKALQEDGKQSAEMSNFLNQMGQWDDSLHDVQEGYYLTGDSVDYVDNAVNRLVEDAKKAKGKTPIEASILSTDELKEKLSDLNSAIDEIQSAYDTLTSACEEYNKNGGKLSIDTIQSLMGLSSEYLACLQDENGQLSINADAMAVLANAKLDEAQALAIEQAMTELNTIATGNHTKATADYVTGNAALLTSLQTLSGKYDEVASSAMTAAQAQALSAGIDAASAVDPEATKKTMDALNEKLKLISATRTQISTGNLGSLKKSGSSSKGSSSSSDPIKEQFEAEYNLLKHNLEMEYITEEQYYNGVQALNEKYYAGKEKYLDEYRKYEEEVYKGLKSYYKSYCDDMMDYYDKKLDANKMSYKEYCDSVSKMLADMHNSGKISDKDWYDYTKTMLEKQKDIYEKALSAITRRLEKEIDTWQDKIDALNKENDNLNDQKDKMDSAIDAITKVYDTEIDRIQGIIDGLKDANDERERTLALEKAKYELERAYNQRVKKIYKEDQGFVYEADYESIRDKKDTLANAELDIKTAELQKQIDALEEFKNKWQEVPNKFQEGIDHMNATALIGSEYQKTILNNNILDLENFQNSYISIQTKLNDNEQLIASYEEKIEYYEMLKEQWSSLSDEYSNNVEDMYAKQLIGQQWETDVLNGRIQTLNDFRNEYNRIQQAISDMAWNSANAQIAAQNAIKEAEATKAKTSGGSNGYSGSSGTATKVGSSGGGTAAPKVCKIIDENSGRLLHTSKSESEASSWISSNGYSVVSNYTSKDGSYITYEVRKNATKTGRFKVYNTKTNKYVKTGFSTFAEAQNYINSTTPALAKYLQVKGYAKGTQNAERGIKPVSEKGDEIVISKDEAKLVHGEQLYNFEGGEKVIPGDETKEILKNQGNVTRMPDGRELFEDGSIKFPDGTVMTPVPSLLGNITQTEFAKAMKNVPLPHYQQKPMNYSNITKTETIDQSVSIGEIHVHEQKNADQFAKEIVTKFPQNVLHEMYRK